MNGILRIAITGAAVVGLLVPGAAFAQEERPLDAMRAIGEITSVDMGASTFTLLTRGGDENQYLTGERTRFRGEGVESLADLEPGMHALVGSVQTENGLLALLVAARQPKQRPGLDLRAVGEVVQVGDHRFTLQKRDGEQLNFSVNADTKFKGISGFEQLQPGMLAAVGAVETEDGWLAVWVGARQQRERPERERQRDPENRPLRPTEEPAEQEVTA